MIGCCICWRSYKIHNLVVLFSFYSTYLHKFWFISYKGDFLRSSVSVMESFSYKSLKTSSQKGLQRFFLYDWRYLLIQYLINWYGYFIKWYFRNRCSGTWDTSIQPCITWYFSTWYTIVCLILRYFILRHLLDYQVLDNLVPNTLVPYTLVPDTLVPDTVKHNTPVTGTTLSDNPVG